MTDLGIVTGATPDALAQFEAFLGRNVDRVGVYLDYATWASLTFDVQSKIPHWQATIAPRKLTVSVPLLVKDGVSTLAQVAAGDFDRYYLAVANQLELSGFGDSIIRPGWEFNIGQPWKAAGHVSDWVAAYRHVTSIFRGASPSFRFDWCSSLGYGQIPTDTAYPGDGYVHIISSDTYDAAWPAIADAQGRWNHLLTMPYGLTWLETFARQRGKAIGFPEWGLSQRSDGHGGGDDPLFITSMAAWIKANNVAYHCYFDTDEPTALHALSHFPNGSTAYKAAFG